jgi:hypothetical protein
MPLLNLDVTENVGIEPGNVYREYDDSPDKSWGYPIFRHVHLAILGHQMYSNSILQKPNIIWS